MVATTTRRDDASESLAQLGLMLPVTVEDVREAYFQRAQRLHPDRGGDANSFNRLQVAYKHASEYAASHGIKWLAPRIELYAKQQRVVENVRKLGGYVELEETTWLKREVGEDFAHVFDQVVGIHVFGPNIDDDFMGFLVDHHHVLAHLRALELTASRVTAEKLGKLLHQFPTLIWLGLNETPLARWQRFKLKWAYPRLTIITS